MIGPLFKFRFVDLFAWLTLVLCQAKVSGDNGEVILTSAVCYFNIIYVILICIIYIYTPLTKLLARFLISHIK